jgi:hypothetical protein
MRSQKALLGLQPPTGRLMNNTRIADILAELPEADRAAAAKHMAKIELALNVLYGVNCDMLSASSKCEHN